MRDGQGAHADFRAFGLDQGGKFGVVGVGKGLSAEIGSTVCVAPRPSLL